MTNLPHEPAQPTDDHVHISVSSFESHTIDGVIVHKCECGAYGTHAGIRPIQWGIDVRQHL
ncbi:MAG TPA: hypothetical protein VGO53_16580 [Steroidobacteraceae bacterium]|jgi:hypothetical protein|nr:hypothetical protein [Steroidobacteraceae bacterium]